MNKNTVTTIISVVVGGGTLAAVVSFFLPKCFPDDHAPLAQIAASKEQGTAPLLVIFDGSKSSDPDGDPLQYRWMLDDEVVSEDSSFRRIFSAPGQHSVTLTVSDGMREAHDVTSIIIEEASDEDMPALAEITEADLVDVVQRWFDALRSGDPEAGIGLSSLPFIAYQGYNRVQINDEEHLTNYWHGVAANGRKYRFGQLVTPTFESVREFKLGPLGNQGSPTHVLNMAGVSNKDWATHVSISFQDVPQRGTFFRKNTLILRRNPNGGVSLAGIWEMEEPW